MLLQLHIPFIISRPATTPLLTPHRPNTLLSCKNQQQQNHSFLCAKTGVLTSCRLVTHFLLLSRLLSDLFTRTTEDTLWSASHAALAHFTGLCCPFQRKSSLKRNRSSIFHCIYLFIFHLANTHKCRQTRRQHDSAAHMTHIRMTSAGLRTEVQKRIWLQPSTSCSPLKDEI